MTIKTETNYKVPNLERGLAILELLAEHRTGLTIQEIKNKLQLSQTTVFRITQSLLQLGYLGRDEESKIFFSTRKMLSIGFQTISEHNLLESALPWMRRLRDIVKETVFLGVMGEGKGIFIEQALGSHSFKFMLSPGKPFYYHSSAPGKAMLAYLPEKERKIITSKLILKKLNENTITSKKELTKELDEAVQFGYAFDREETLKGVVCIGAPILDYQGYPIASIWISGPADRLNKSIWKENGELIRSYADKISLEMGY